MFYHFHKDINENCILILGDVGGNVRVLQFSPVDRGPFRNQAGRALITLRHVDLQRRVSRARAPRPAPPLTTGQRNTRYAA